MRRSWIAGALALGVLCPMGVGAQRDPSRMAWMPPQSTGSVDFTPPLLSLVVPGAGQHLLGQNRKWAYLALEVAGWAFYLERRHAGGDYRDRYRDFAWENGRIQSAARIDGDFEYYERIAHWTRSGEFDRDASSPGLQPEQDETTFNGSVWSLATRIFLGGATNIPESDPAYQSALAYYGEEAYATRLLWDWTGMPAAQTQYAALLDASDSRFRQATTIFGLVIANHVLSAADAYLSARSRSAALRLRLEPDLGTGFGTRVVLTLTPPR